MGGFRLVPVKIRCFPPRALHRSEGHRLLRESSCALVCLGLLQEQQECISRSEERVWQCRAGSCPVANPSCASLAASVSSVLVSSGAGALPIAGQELFSLAEARTDVHELYLVRAQSLSSWGCDLLVPGQMACWMDSSLSTLEFFFFFNGLAFFCL